ncbi:3-dehydroquinate synthase [Sporosarcina sp. NCCP-2716]|uniref:3-dehydroquinate synthase n=1 Tax=Sporosarcina sp. NCCP-2716 TaxID=2943679 RepID=UPI00204109BE|nr:3-dehydroquinate synthase [Sporosarcina sp. NCCP-2716]GKV67951.1 3-dehydroquinate synthase [Sporosarcina sp. NCCP-2716]
MEQITVVTGGSSYPVHIGEDVYRLFSEEYKELLLQADKIAVFADGTAAGLHADVLMTALERAGVRPLIHLLPSGEASKTADSFIACQSFLLLHGFTRNSLLIAFGGGACGDLTGFVAATFMRGIPFLQCPTTILAHDSAVGGKTAINMPEGKNMVGAFHQPAGVLFESRLFATLPEREVRSGMAELLKHAMISDAAWADALLSDMRFPHLPPAELDRELMKGIQVKAAIVGADEFEQGTRKFLNFGHTLGHAAEAYFGYGAVSHGECVMIGMAYSMLLSETFGGVRPEETDRFIGSAVRSGYPLERLLDVPFGPLLDFMRKDKKAVHGEIIFVLLEHTGRPFTQPVPESVLASAYSELATRIRKGLQS